MWMRTGLAPVAAGLVWAALTVGCGGEEDDPSSQAAGGAAKPKVGIVLHFTAIDYFKRFIDGARDGAAAVGGELEVTGTPTPDPPAGVRMFRDLATKVDDGIGVVASPPDFWVRPLQEVSEDGVPLLATVEPPAEGSSTLRTFVGDNGHQTGATLAREIASLVDDPQRTGTVVIGTGDPALPTLANRTAGMRKVLEQELPNARVVVQAVGLEPVKNLAAWQAIFRKYRDDALAFLADGEHSGANLAKTAAQLPGDYRVGVVDMDVPTAEGIESGRIDIAIGGVPYLRGYLTGRLLAQAAKEGGEIPPGWIDVCCEIATKDGIDAILERLKSDDAMRAYYDPIMRSEFSDLASIPVRPLEEVYEPLGPATGANPWLEPAGS